MPRLCSPSLVLMERMTAIRSMCLATLGSNSLILMPGTAVGICLRGPPLTWPGFRSKVSICDGPPFIHSRIHALRRFGCAAASWARAPSQLDTEKPATPAALSFSQSRREGTGVRAMCGIPWVVRAAQAAQRSERVSAAYSAALPARLGLSMIQEELRAVQQHPEDVAQGGPGVAADAARLDVADEPLALLCAGRARQRRQ